MVVVLVAGERSLDGPVDGVVPLEGCLVVERSGAGDRRHDEAAVYRFHLGLVFVEVADRADRLGDDDETVRMVRRALSKLFEQQRRQDESREVVVGQRRVTAVRRDDVLLAAVALGSGVGVGEFAVGVEVAVDVHLVGLVLAHRLERLVTETEPPVALVVTRPVGDGVGHPRQRVEVVAEFVEREFGLDGDAVVDDMEVVVGEVDDAFAVAVGDVRLPDVPLRRDLPVVDRRPRADCPDVQRRHLREPLQRPSHTVAGQTPRYREEIGEQLVHGVRTRFSCCHCLTVSRRGQNDTDLSAYWRQ